MNLELENRNCIVIGGSRGIGWVVGECVSVDGGQHRGMR